VRGKDGDDNALDGNKVTLATASTSALLDRRSRSEFADDTASPLVEVENLTVSFTRGGSTIHALRGVSLSIAPGEIVGLVGESGSGKSVLGLSLLGLHRRTAGLQMTGSVRVGGVDMVRATHEEQRLVRKRHLGAVFQDPMSSLNPTMRVGRQVAEAAGSLEAAEELLGIVGIPDPKSRLRAFPHELSGGLRQRVMIAMAIAGSPSLIVADEPTTALDVTVQAQILELVARLRDELSTSFLFVTHDLGVAAEIADRIVVMYAGKVAEVGPASAMLGGPSHPYSLGLLRSRLLLGTDRERPIRTLPGEPPDPRTISPGCAFMPRCSFARPECAETEPVLRAVVGPEQHLAACHALGEPEPDSASADLLQPWPVHDAVRAPTELVLLGVEKSFTVRSGLHSRSLKAVRGIDLELREGEAIALVGESGCGKSTLLRLIAGLQQPDAGTIDLARDVRPQMVFQDPGSSLTPWLTIGDLIADRLRAEKVPAREHAERAKAALALVGLPDEVSRARVGQLSGGQRQRAALARAIVIPPRVLLCDEPTSALDVSLAATVLNLIGELRRELGMAVIFVTHDLAAARVVADRIAVMYLGKVVDIGTAAELTDRPLHPYAAALLATVPGTGRRVRLAGDPASALDIPDGCSFHPRCAHAQPTCACEEPVLTSLGDGPWARQVACPIVLSRLGDPSANTRPLE